MRSASKSAGGGRAQPDRIQPIPAKRFPKSQGRRTAYWRPEPTIFLNASLGVCPIIRPTETQGAAMGGHQRPDQRWTLHQPVAGVLRHDAGPRDESRHGSVRRVSNAAIGLAIGREDQRASPRWGRERHYYYATISLRLDRQNSDAVRRPHERSEATYGVCVRGVAFPDVASLILATPGRRQILTDLYQAS